MCVFAFVMFKTFGATEQCIFKICARCIYDQPSNIANCFQGNQGHIYSDELYVYTRLIFCGCSPVVFGHKISNTKECSDRLYATSSHLTDTITETAITKHRCWSHANITYRKFHHIPGECLQTLKAKTNICEHHSFSAVVISPYDWGHAGIEPKQKACPIVQCKNAGGSKSWFTINRLCSGALDLTANTTRWHQTNTNTRIRMEQSSPLLNTFW